MKCTLFYRLAALQHIPCLHSAFDGNSTSLQYRLMSLSSICVLFLFSIQFRYMHTTVAWPSSAQLPLYYLASTWLSLPPISTPLSTWLHMQSLHLAPNDHALVISLSKSLCPCCLLTMHLECVLNGPLWAG